VKTENKVNVYQILTDRIIAALEAGTVPWRKTWSTIGGGAPRNHHSGKAYRGINWFMLQLTGFESSRWVTFKQAQELGGSVRKGEKSNIVSFWKKWKTTDKATGEEKELPVLRYFNVFNLEQCEGIHIPGSEKITLAAHERIAAAEAIVAAMPTRPQLFHKGGRACYSPALDSVTMPEMGRFTSAEEYYSTLFHELAHSTGHNSRLGRIKETATFGDEDYGKEELVAEMTAAFLCARCGIDAPLLENQAAYIAGWLKLLRSDSKLVVFAAAQAAKAADYILGESAQWEKPVTESEDAPLAIEEIPTPAVEVAAGQLSLF
jgi:antirestriction protein ArdC